MNVFLRFKKPKRPNKPLNAQGTQSGVALILVIFITALASLVAISLATSTYISSRTQRSFERQLAAQYLLKSSLNVARAIIASNPSDNDPFQDSWGAFRNGQTVPGELFGVTEPNVSISLEIRSEEGKIPVRWLKDESGGSGPTHDRFLKNRVIFKRLFDLLDFNKDKEVEDSELFKGRHFSSEEMIANLIDYMDSDTASYGGEGGFAKGIESEVPPKTFANKELESFDELAQIPGFTPNRLRKLANHLTTVAKTAVNVNFASSAVLQAVDPELDSGGADKIIEYREKTGPFQSDTFASDLPPLMPSFDDLKNSVITYRTTFLRIISKVQYGDQRFFLRAYVLNKKEGEAKLPKVLEYEMIG